MIRRALAASVFALILLFSSLPQASAADGPCRGQDLVERLRLDEPDAYRKLLAEHARFPNGEGNFWRVEKAGLRPSYLFGTAHVSDARTIRLIDDIRDALSSSDILLVELNLSQEPPGSREAAIEAHGMLPEGETLDDRLDEGERAALATAAAQHGLPWFSARRMRPSLLHATLSIPPCAKLALLRGETMLDDRIARVAEEAGVEVAALETMEEQVAAMGRLNDEIQLAALLETVRQAKSLLEDMHETIIVLHQGAKAAMAFTLMEASKAYYPASYASWRDFRGPLIDERNVRMVERALPYVEKGGAFIAVGALHLPGETGLWRACGAPATRSRA